MNKNNRFRFLPLLLFVMALALFIRIGDLADKILLALQDAGISFNTAIAEDKKAEDKPKADAAKKDGTKEADKKEAAPADDHKEEDAEDEEVADEAKDVDPDDETRPPSEITLLQQLNDQRQAMTVRAAEMDNREALLKAAEQQINQKTAELTKLKTEIEDLLKQAENKQETQMKGLVKIYETMKPKDAANILNTLETNVLLDLTGRMKESKLAPILAAMNPDRARQITTELAGRAQKIPKTDVVDGAVPAAAPKK